jgi:hypothetical protein
MPNAQLLTHAARDSRQPDHDSRSEQHILGNHLVAGLGSPTRSEN